MVTAELVGKVGRLRGQQPPNEHGLTLTVKVLPGSRGSSSGQRCTACALTADALGVVTETGTVYAVHLNKQRYTCLDTLDTACTAAAFMTRLSRRLFVGCSNGEIHCFDISSSARLAKLPGHRTAVTSLSTKSDTEQLLSAATDAVLLWDMQTFRQRRMLSSAPYGSTIAAFSPTGNIAAAAAASGELVLWNAKNLHEIGRLSTPLEFTPSCLSICPDEKWLLVGCRAPALLLLYSLQRLQLEHALQLPAEMYGISQVQLLPDSCSAAVLASNGSISFLDTQACRFTSQLQLTFPGCRASSFSLDARGNSMAVVCSDGLVRLYDLSAVRRAAQRQGPAQQVHRLQESDLQQLVAGVSKASNVRSKSSSAADGGSGQGQPLQVLSDVGNMPARASGKPAKQQARGSQAAGPGQLRTQQLDVAAAGLNKLKLQDMLRVYGEFPARYRQMIWDHLLQLPHNSAVFSLLQDKGVHPAYKDLVQQMQMPGGNRSSQAVRLQACLSQLAHWCPLFGEAGFLPRFVFPFVKLYGARAEIAFEVVATLLLNWCKGWFELFPNPPVPLMRRFLLLVSQHDLELGSHLQQLSLPLLQQLWHHLSGALTDLLPSHSDLLVFWDHCLAAPAGPGFMYQLLSSYLVAQRQLLLAVRDEQQLERLFESRPAVDIQQVVKQAYKLHDSTPHYAHLGLATFTPLPSAGCYPVFNEYPVGSVELQALERRRIQEAEEALIRRRQVVAELEQRSKQVAFDSAALTAQRQQLAALDAQRRAAMRAIEDSLAAAGARLDDRGKEEKLKQIRLMEEAYQASLASLRAEWCTELAALKSDIDHKRRQTAATLKARQEEEDLKALEFQAQQRVWALQQEEMAAAGASALQDAAAAQTAALTAEQQRKAAEWQAQDEARALRQQHETARKARLVAAAEQEAARQAAKGLLLAQELQVQQELMKVEHQRLLRQLAEDEAELTAQQLQLQVERQAVVAAAGQQAVLEQAHTQKNRFAEQQQQRMASVAGERDALRERQAELHMAAADIGAAARLSTAEQQLAELEDALRQADEEHAARVEQIVLQLQKDKQSHEQVMNVLRAGDPNLSAAAAAMASASQAPPARSAAAAPRAASLEARLAALQTRMAAKPAATVAAQQQPAEPAGSSAAGDAEDAFGAAIREFAAASRQGEQARQSPAEQRTDWEANYGGVVAELQETLSRRRQAAGAAAAGPAPAAAAAARAAGSASSSSGGVGSTASSLNVSQELEQLLAETEAEVQLEIAYKEAAQAGLQAQQRRQQQQQQQVKQRKQTSPKSGASASRGTAAAGSSSSARLTPVFEEEPPLRAVRAAPAARLAGGKVRSGTASPASGSGSPVRAGAAARSGLVTSTARPGSIGSPPAVQLAVAGLEPLTHHGKAVAGLSEALQAAPPGSSSGSSGGSSGSRGLHAWRHRQQQLEARLSPAAAMFDGSPSTQSSFLTASSTGGNLTSSPERTTTSAARSGAQGVAGGAGEPGRAGDAEAAESSTYSLYEPVLLGVADRSGPGRGTAIPLGRTTTSSSSTQQSSASHPSSKSLSFDAPAASTDSPGRADRDTPMLGARSRARTAAAVAAGSSGSSQAAEAGAAAAAAAMQPALGLRGSVSSDGSLGSERESESGAAAGVAGTLSSGRLGLDPSGRVSAELRQSSSATSEELEQLLHQLAQYEQHLIEGEVASAQPGQPGQVPGGADAGSDVGTSMSSLSWSATLAGLANLLPQNE